MYHFSRSGRTVTLICNTCMAKYTRNAFKETRTNLKPLESCRPKYLNLLNYYSISTIKHDEFMH